MSYEELEGIEDVEGKETPDCPYCHKPTYIWRVWIRGCIHCGRQFRLVRYNPVKARTS